MITAIRYLDCCLPGYFQGSSHVVLCVPVDGSTTYGQLRQGLEDDANGAYHGIEDWTGFEDALGQVIDRPADTIAFPHLDVRGDDDSGDSVYAYFALIQDKE